VTGVWIVANESWRRMSAARATTGFAVLFSLLAIGVSYFGLAGQRAVGFQGFARMTTSLFNIVVYVIPLTALIIGAAEVTGRRDNMALFLVQPIRRSAVLLGSFLGVAGALSAAVIIGLGGAGLFISLKTSTASLGAYLVLLSASLGLLLSFLAMGFLLGVFLLDRLRAMAASILVWFVAVIGYDLAIIGISSVLRGVPLKTILLPAILLNPVDLCRVMVTVAGGRGALFGPAGANLVKTFGAPEGSALAAVSLLMLIVIPILFALRVFRRRDL
jgi:Cu-processing system permease protein